MDFWTFCSNSFVVKTDLSLFKLWMWESIELLKTILRISENGIKYI